MQGNLGNLNLLCYPEAILSLFLKGLLECIEKTISIVYPVQAELSSFFY